jgi:tetratricopeptide (TPR) repeat protein
MENKWEILKNASILIQKWKIDEAKIIYEEVYKLLDKKNIIDWTEPLGNYIGCLLWLWEIYMKSNNLEKSLQYYLEWNELTEWKDFNIVFNLWVVYSNLNDEVNSKKYLKIAKDLEPNNSNLLNFLAIIDSQWWEEDTNQDVTENVQNTNNNSSFKDKIQDMMKKINN